MVKKGRPAIALLTDASSAGNIAWANRLAVDGFRVHLISHQAPGKGLSRDVICHRLLLPVSYPITYLAFAEALLLMFRLRPRIIHARHLSDYGILAGLLCRLGRFKPVVLTATGSDVLVDARTHRGWAIKHVLPLASLIACYRKDAADEVCRYVNPERVLLLNPEDETALLAQFTRLGGLSQH